MMEKEQKWLKSKIVRFLFVYYGFIIAMTYAVEWANRHAAALWVVIFGAIGLVMLFVIGRFMYYRLRQW